MSTLLNLLAEREYSNDDVDFTVVMKWLEWREVRRELKELAALRAQAAEAETLRATVAAQARRLTEIQTECDDWHTLAMEEAAALEYIVKMVDEDVSDEVVIRHMYHAAKSALAAHAPAQTEAEEGTK